jgi:hypothetical protein
MGKWYFEGDGATKYSHLKAYSNIDKLHEMVHQSASAKLQCGPLFGLKYRLSL